MDGRVEDADDFAGLFGCDREWLAAFDCFHDVTVIGIPMTSDRRDSELGRGSIGLGSARGSRLVLGELRCGVDVSGTKGSFLEDRSRA